MDHQSQLALAAQERSRVLMGTFIHPIKMLLLPFEAGDITIRSHFNIDFMTYEFLVELENFPDDEFLLKVDRDDINMLGEDRFFEKLGVKVGTYYAGLRLSVEDHVILGEN